MKRSQILELLDKEINKRCNYGTVFEEKDIENILNIIEKAGMYPKWYTIKYTDSLGVTREEYRTGWEPED